MITRDLLLERIQEPFVAETPFVSCSVPIPSFGDLTKARVLTIGKSVGHREFVDEIGTPYPASDKHFVDRETLGIDKYQEPNREQAERVLDSCNQYFDTNALSPYFGALQEFVLDPIGVSYRDGTAAHIDLLQWAIDPLKSDFEEVLRWGQSWNSDWRFMDEILRLGQFDQVFMNGKIVVDFLSNGKLCWPVKNLKVPYDTKTLTQRVVSIHQHQGAQKNLFTGWDVELHSTRRGIFPKVGIRDWIASNCN